MKKLTKEDIDMKIQNLFQGKVTILWEQSPNYTNSKQKVLASHALFGEWNVSVSKLLQGQNHPMASIRFHSKDAINKEIDKQHKTLVKINWEKTSFPLKLKDTVYAVDADYGEWKTKLSALIKGEGHILRYYQSKRTTKESINSKINKIFKGKVKILWTKDPYKNNKQTVLAQDIDYGVWKIKIYKLLLGIQHPDRAKKSIADKNRLTIKEIDARIKKNQKGKVFVDWSKNPHPINKITDKVIATDVDYGDFKMSLVLLMKGSDCKARLLSKSRHSEKEIDTRLKKIFNHQVYIDWSKNESYKRNNQKIIATHIEKGDWTTTVAKLLEGHNHPSLFSNFSKNEKELVHWLKSKGINIVEQKRFFHNKKHFELDIYMPDYNLTIEYNGIYFHSEKFKSKEYHFHKSNLAKKLNISVIHLYENLWNEKKENIKKMILSKIKKQKKNIYPTISTIQYKEYIKYSKENRILYNYKKTNKYYKIVLKNKTIGVFNGLLESNRFVINNIISLNYQENQLIGFIESFLSTKFNIKKLYIYSFNSLAPLGSFDDFILDNIKINVLWALPKKMSYSKPLNKNSFKIYDSGLYLAYKYL